MSVECLPAEPLPAVRARPLPLPRRPRLDAARIVAAYAIVWLHAVGGTGLERTAALGTWAVPFFVFAAVFLAVQTERRRPDLTLARYAWDRFVRIYLPFLAWSGIYLLFKAAKVHFFPEQSTQTFGIGLLWGAGFWHLWFLPFVLAVTVTAFALVRITPSTDAAPGKVNSFLSSVIVGAGVVVALVPTPALEYPWDLAFHAAPAVCWSIGLAMAWPQISRTLENPAATACGLVLAIAGTAWVWYLGPSRGMECLAGLGVMLVALPPRTPSWLDPLCRMAPLAYGIYLAHPMFIKIVESLQARWSTPAGISLALGVFLAASLGATAVAGVLRRFSATRWLIG